MSMTYKTRFAGRARWFWGVSALVLMTATGGVEAAKADGMGGGTWTVDLQGAWDFNRSDAGTDFGTYPANPVLKIPPGAGIGAKGSKPGDGIDFNGKVTYQPESSPWSFALGVKYGTTKKTSRSDKFVNQYYSSGSYGLRSVKTQESEKHSVVDFEIGHDVGVGIFGGGVTTVGAGVRFAHFESTTTGSFSTYSNYTTSRAGTINVKRKNDAVGPRVFIQSVSPLPGVLGDGGLSLGWGVGGGILFGKQTVDSNPVIASGNAGPFTKVSRSQDHKTGTVDGFVQINWDPFKSPVSVNFGYKFDVFTDALDGGYAVSREVNQVNQGPFIGLSLKLK